MFLVFKEENVKAMHAIIKFKVYISLTVLALIPIKVTTTPEFALTVGVGVSE